MRLQHEGLFEVAQVLMTGLAFHRQHLVGLANLAVCSGAALCRRMVESCVVSMSSI